MFEFFFDLLHLLCDLFCCPIRFRSMWTDPYSFTILCCSEQPVPRPDLHLLHRRSAVRCLGEGRDVSAHQNSELLLLQQTWSSVSLNLHAQFCFYKFANIYEDQNGSAAMLAAKRSAGVAPEVNLRNALHISDEANQSGNPPWLWNRGQSSPEVQNRGISGPTKRTYVLQNFNKRSL